MPFRVASSSHASEQDESPSVIPLVPFVFPRPPPPVPTILVKPPNARQPRAKLHKIRRGSKSNPHHHEDVSIYLQIDKSQSESNSKSASPERNRTDSSYQDIILVMPPSTSGDGLNTPRRSEWSEDSEEEARSLRRISHCRRKGKKDRRKKWNWWLGAVVLLLIVAIIVGIVVGLRGRFQEDEEPQDSSLQYDSKMDNNTSQESRLNSI